MINQLPNLCKLFQKSKNMLNFACCISIEKKETILILKNPRLVCLLEQNDKKNIIIDTAFTDVTEQDSSIDLNAKFEKKNKINFRLNEKNKIRPKKKARSKMNLDNEDILLENENTISNNNKDSLNLSLIRPNKLNKQKKKYRSENNQNINDKISAKIIKKENSSEVSNIIMHDKKSRSKEIMLDSPLTVRQLANKLQISEAAIITRLFLKGISVTINQVVDTSIATEVALHYNFTILNESVIQSINNIEKIKNNFRENGDKRAPIITILGHVDHGKTTILDYIRQTKLVQEEVGGITQSIAGYEVEWEYQSSKEKLIFLDTPGHEAFTGMRSRGAEVTDLAILVVAADDGLKPQSLEVIDHIISRKIPYIVALNKIDKKDIDTNKIKKQLAEYSIIEKNWRGRSSIIEISALTGENMDQLLSAICELSVSLDLKADPFCLAEGTILEAHLDKKTGPIAHIIIQNGTLKVGNIIVSGNIYGRIRAIIDSHGMKINQSGPSTVVEILGFSSIPQTGIKFYIARDEKEAKKLVSHYSINNDFYDIYHSLNSRVTLDSYNDKSSLKEINLIIKTDTQGSIEAIINSFSQIPQDKVQINILSANSGSISHTDIDLASNSQSLIVGFNISISSNIINIAEKSGVIISTFNVIYDLLDYIRYYMLDLIDPEYDKVAIGKAVVQTVFNVNKGIVAGCIVNSGKLKKNSYIRVYRSQELIHDGILDSLKRIKDDVNEVIAGNECGVMCIDYHLWDKFDIIEAYELVEKKKVL